MDVLSQRQEAMRLEGDALFRRIHDLTPAERDHSSAAPAVDAPSITGAPAGMPASLVNVTQCCVSGGGSAASASAGPAAQTSGASTSVSDTLLVCSQCNRPLINRMAHRQHCNRPGSRCKDAHAIPFNEWKVAHDHRQSEAALTQLSAQHFVDHEANILDREMQDMYYNRMTPATTIDRFKETIKAHDERCAAELMRRLSLGKSESEASSIQQQVTDIFSACQRLETDTSLHDRVQPAPARYRELVDRPDADGQAQGPRRGDHVYDVPIADGLHAILRDNPQVLNQWRTQASSWEAKAGESITVYADITDGSVFRNHPELGVEADRSDGTLRLGLILYYDEVEVVNAIGQFSGTHKIGLFYWGLLNYGPEVRMDLSNIHLATVVLDADVSYYGIEQIVSGPPGELDWAPNGAGGSSIGASLRSLDQGIALSEPSGGNFIPVPTRGWLVVVSADNPAAALLTGTMGGTSANRFCRQCTVDRRTAGYDQPCSFINPSSSSTCPALRTQASRDIDMEICGDCEGEMGSAGWKSWSHAFARIPHFDFLTCLPEDLMHDEYEGVVKGEVAHFIFYAVRIQRYFTLDDLNRELDAYPWPGGTRPVPYFTEGFLTGDTAAKVADKKAKKARTEVKKREVGDPQFVPKPGAHVHMTAGQMATFTAHSPQIFLNLGVPADDPAFITWLDHCQYLNLLMQHSISIEELSEIDRLIQEHQNGLKALSKIYPNVWKPKHHYVCHFPLDIKHFGPPRHYWCMRFEALNQVFKKIAVGGSYRDTTRRCAEFWCMRSALARQGKASIEDWAPIVALGESAQLTFRNGDPDIPAHVQDALETYPLGFGGSVTSTSISEIRYQGKTIIAGTSWLLLKLDGDAEPILASVLPLTGIFTVDSNYFFEILVYDGATLSAASPMRTMQILQSRVAELTPEIISPEEILEVKVLWPAKCERDGDLETWTFVEM